MTPRLLSRRSLTLLLAFVLGGIVTPLAHEVAHLFEDVHVQGFEMVASSPHESNPSHDCDLCEVRLAAVGVDYTDQEAYTGISADVVQAPEAMPLSPLRAFDGRAPPSLL